jgi:hypothetical protein
MKQFTILTAIGAICAGAEEDGVAIGDNLCYRCRNGARPQVMVFTRSTDEKIVALIKNLDKAVASNSDKQLRAFVNLLGEDKDALQAEAKKVAKTSQAKNVPFVVPNEFENGPDNYGLNAKAAITIIVANNGQVTASHAVTSAEELKVDEILKDVQKIVN